MPSPTQARADHWNQVLCHFRFQRAHGGYANDMDCIVARISFEPGAAGLLALCERLGLSHEGIPPGADPRQGSRQVLAAVG